MNRQQKELIVSLLKKDFIASQASFLVKFRGLTVSQMQNLRIKLREKEGELKVAKARLIKRAVADNKAKALIPFCKDQIGVVFTSNEGSEIAKVLYNFSKKQKALFLVVGLLNDQLLNDKEIAYIASLPSKKVLLAQVFGAIKAPVVNVIMVLRMPVFKLLWIIEQLIEKRKKTV